MYGKLTGEYYCRQVEKYVGRLREIDFWPSEMMFLHLPRFAPRLEGTPALLPSQQVLQHIASYKDRPCRDADISIICWRTWETTRTVETYEVRFKQNSECH